MMQMMGESGVHASQTCDRLYSFPHTVGHACGSPLLLIRPSSSHLPYYTRLFHLVIQSNRDLLEQLAETSSASTSPYLPHLSRVLLPILTLVQTLYLSPNATDLQHAGEGIIGEELLHWLNSYDLAPTTEQGREIAASDEPYLHANYWDYILRCTLRGFHATVGTLLATLLSLPSKSLKTLVARMRELIKALPRSTEFKTEVQFKAARRDFHLKLMGILASLEGVMDEVQDELTSSFEDREDPEEEAEDLRLSLEAGLRIFLEVLAGNRERVVEAAEDWKEALTAWGTLVDVGLKRDGLADALSKITNLRGEDLEEGAGLPDKAEQVMVKMIKGDLAGAAESMTALDPYLAQVLLDFSTKLRLLDDSDDESDEHVTPLEKANLVYSNTLLATYGLWRIAMDYLSEAGTSGTARMSQILLGLPLLESADDKKRRLARQPTEDENGEQRIVEEVDGFHLMESVLEACSTFGLEREARAVCRKLSLHLSSVASKDEKTAPRFGPAVIYALRSPPRGDIAVLKTIKGRMLEGLLERKSRVASTTTATAEGWFIDEVTEIKRWLIKVARRDALGDGQADAVQRGPFLNRTKRSLASRGDGFAEEDQYLLDDEEEFNHHFAQSLPPVLLFLTNLARFFKIKQESGNGPLSITFLLELLNAGLVDGDWTSVCLYEIGEALQRSGSTATEPALLYDSLRLLESITFSASLSGEEEDFYLGKLGQWTAGSRRVRGEGGGGATAELKKEGLDRARRCLQTFRLRVAMALGVGGLGSSSSIFAAGNAVAAATESGVAVAGGDEMMVGEK